jgi:hypothetical protein
VPFLSHIQWVIGLSTTLTTVNERGIAKIKFAGNESGDKPPETMQVDEPEASQEPTISLEETERQQREADLERIRYMTLERQREIAHLDMLGEYGSKVSVAIHVRACVIHGRAHVRSIS